MTTFAKPPADMTCPQFKKPMNKVCPTCPWWTQVRGTNPQTGGEVDGFNCAVALLPLLLIDNARVQRGTQAATESMRNEVVKRMDADLIMRSQTYIGAPHGNGSLALEDDS